MAKDKVVRYNAKFIVTVKMLVLECGMFNSRGEIAWTKVAKYLGVTRQAIHHWRDKSNTRYKREFAKAMIALQEKVNSGTVKASALVTARKHTLIKRRFEDRRIGPWKPLWGWSIALLTKYAKEQLNLELAGKWKKEDLIYEIRAEIEAQTETKSVLVMREMVEVDPNIATQKLVLQNLGPAEDRWNVKDQVEGSGITSINITVEEVTEDPNAGKKIEDA